MASASETVDMQAPTDIQQVLQEFQTNTTKHNTDLSSFLTNLETFAANLQSSSGPIQQAFRLFLQDVSKKVGEMQVELAKSNTHIQQTIKSNQDVSDAEFRLLFLDEQHELVLEQNLELLQKEFSLQEQLKIDECESAWYGYSVGISENQQHTTQLRDELSGVSKQLVASSEQVTSLTRERDTLKRERLAQMVEYTKINGEQAALHLKDMATKQQTINELQGSIDELQEDNSEHQITIDTLTNRVGVLENEINVQRQDIASKQNTINAQEAAKNSTSTQHAFIVEMLEKSRIVSTNLNKAQLRKYVYTYQAEFERFTATKRGMRGIIIAWRNECDELEERVADLQKKLDARVGEIEQLQKGHKQTIDTLDTKHQTSLEAQYEDLRSEFQKVFEKRCAKFNEAFRMKTAKITKQEQAKYAADLSAATVKHATDLSAATLKHSTELALVKSSIATDIQAARNDERQLQQAAFDTKLNTALQDQASTKQAEFDTKLAADLQKQEAELSASHASKLTAALEEQRKSLQAQFDADTTEALEKQRLEMDTKHRNKMDLARARWGKRPAPVSNSSASNVETSTTGSSSLGLIAAGDASAIDASTVAIVDAAPVTETSPPNNALPDIRLDTLPQRKSPPKRPAPAPETNDQASRRSKRSRVSNLTSEPETSVSRLAVSNPNDMASKLWAMFKIDGLSDEESASLRAVLATRLFNSKTRTLETVIELIDKYVTGKFDGEPPFPGPCFLAAITGKKKGSGGVEMKQDNCPHCVEYRELVCCYATYVDGVAEGFPARVNGQIKKKDRVWLKDAQPRTVESDGRQVRWVLHKR